MALLAAEACFIALPGLSPAGLKHAVDEVAGGALDVWADVFGVAEGKWPVEGACNEDESSPGVFAEAGVLDGAASAPAVNVRGCGE